MYRHLGGNHFADSSRNQYRSCFHLESGAEDVWLKRLPDLVLPMGEAMQFEAAVLELDVLSLALVLVVEDYACGTLDVTVILLSRYPRRFYE